MGRSWRYLVALLALVSCAGWALGRTFYDILEVSRSADEAQIKRAFRKLAMQYHPDRNPGDESAAKKFAEINEAYEVLSDRETRAIYDQHGEEGVRRHRAGAGQQQQGFPGGVQFDFGGFSFSFGDDAAQKEVKGDDVVVELSVTLEDLYNGQEFALHREKAVFVETSGFRQCNCQQKMVTRQLGPGMFQQYTTTECERCPNVKAETRGEVLEVHVEPGMREGQEIRLREEGEPHPDGEAGDLRFRLRQEPHPRFRREDDDLHFDLPITLTEALVGFSKAIRHLDGHWVEVTESGVTRHGEERVVAGEGMPIHDSWGNFGDLHIHFQVAFPSELTPAQKAQVRKLGFTY